MDIKDFLVDENYTIIDAMKRLDKVAKKVLFVVEKGKLLAAITDGDIRRWILRNGSLEASLKEVANYEPKYLYEEEQSLANAYLKKYSIDALPILNKQNEIVSVVLRNNEVVRTRTNLDVPVVIMAGGLGTRLYPYTKVLPKPLIPIGDLPIAEHIINRFNQYGINRFFMVVNYKRRMIKAYFSEIEKNYDIYYVEEDKPLGTGGGLSLLKGKIHSTFILSNCDILINENYEKIYKYHKDSRNVITMVCSLKNVRIPYGVIEIGNNGEIIQMKEKPELSFLVNTGMYIVEPTVIESMDNTPISFPEVVSAFKEKGAKIGVYPISENAWLDMGQHDELEEMKRRLGIDE